MRLARSYLFAPGSHERLLQKVFSAGADAVVVDLEDAVAPEHKAFARDLVGRTLARRGPAGDWPLVFVRINSVRSGLWRDDLHAVVGRGLHGVRLARTESVEEVREVNDEIERLERGRDLPRGALSIIASIETADAVLGAAAIARGPRVLALAFGASDFLRDVGAGPDAGELETLAVRTHLVVVSRAASIAPPIAPVHTRLSDMEELRRTTEAARRLGFFGRSCIHPLQLPVVHQAFLPSAAHVAEARALVEAASAGATTDGPVHLPDGPLVDRSLVRRAAAVIDLARRLESAKDAEAGGSDA
jgi:citrate lyase subunit beta/citryl-CoA lyase